MSNSALIPRSRRGGYQDIEVSAAHILAHFSFLFIQKGIYFPFNNQNSHSKQFLLMHAFQYDTDISIRKRRNMEYTFDDKEWFLNEIIIKNTNIN